MQEIEPGKEAAVVPEGVLYRVKELDGHRSPQSDGKRRLTETTHSQQSEEQRIEEEQDWWEGNYKQHKYYCNHRILEVFSTERLHVATV